MAQAGKAGTEYLWVLIIKELVKPQDFNSDRPKVPIVRYMSYA